MTDDLVLLASSNCHLLLLEGFEAGWEGARRGGRSQKGGLEPALGRGNSRESGISSAGLGSNLAGELERCSFCSDVDAGETQYHLT